MNVQKLFEYCVTQTEIAATQERVDKAAGVVGSWEIGKKLAYSDVARRLVAMGARVEREENNV